MSELNDKINSLSPDELDLLNSDPKMLADFKAKYSDNPGVLKSAAAGAMSGVPLAETAISGIGSALSDKSYADIHKSLEDLKDKAWEQHPVAYGSGKIAGIAGTGLVAPEGLAGALITGAGYGADAAKDISELPKATAEGTATGAVLHGIGKYAISPLLEKAGEATQSGLASLGKQTTLEDIQNYLKNPNIINNAGTKEEVANKLAGLTSDLGTASGHMSEQARGLLNTEAQPLNISDVKDAAMNALQKYFPEGNNLTKSDEAATKTIIDQYNLLANAAEGNNGVIPETSLRNIIDRIQAATKDSTYGNPEAATSQTALKEFGGNLNSLLRKSNPQYAEAMAPAAEAIGAAKDIGKGFKIEDGQPTDATATKLNNLLKGKPDETELADQLKNMTGTDISEQLHNAQSNENFNAPGTGGAFKLLMTGLGFGAGHMTGLPGAGIGGAALGRYASEGIDGGHIAKSLMDTYLKGTNSPALQKFGPILINAAKSGGNSLAATHFVLATSNPEYQDVINKHLDGSEGGQ